MVPVFYNFLSYFETTLNAELFILVPKCRFCLLMNLYVKITCHIRAHFLGPMGGLKIEGAVYSLHGLELAMISRNMRKRLLKTSVV